MKLIRSTLAVAALALLGGCMVVPVSPGYDGGGYYAAPAYVAPAIGIGIYGGRNYYGGGRHRGYDRDYRRHRDYGGYR